MGHELRPLIVCHPPANLDGHSYFGSIDMFLACHVIYQEHVIKGSCDYIDSLHSW